MNKVINLFNDVISQYQNEIHKKNPSLSLHELQDIWKKFEPNTKGSISQKKEEKDSFAKRE